MSFEPISIPLEEKIIAARKKRDTMVANIALERRITIMNKLQRSEELQNSVSNLPDTRQKIWIAVVIGLCKFKIMSAVALQARAAKLKDLRRYNV